MTIHVNLQWKNSEVCFDFYCECNPEYPQHLDGEGLHLQQFTCGQSHECADETPECEPGEHGPWCGKTWHLPNGIRAHEGPFDQEHCYHRHCGDPEDGSSGMVVLAEGGQPIRDPRKCPHDA